MFLSARSILDNINRKDISIEPFDEGCLKPASYVLHLGRFFRRWTQRNHSIIMWCEKAGEHHLDDPFESDQLTLNPGDFVLGCTNERIMMPANLAGLISPLSHIARFGLSVHCGADWINPCFGHSKPTQLALELKNNNISSLVIDASMPIAHLRFAQISGDLSTCRRHTSIYEGQDPLTTPKLYEEWNRVDNETETFDEK